MSSAQSSNPVSSPASNPPSDAPTTSEPLGANVTRPIESLQQCRVCNQSFRWGELICPHCNTITITKGKTRKIDSTGVERNEKSWSLQPRDMADVTIIFEIDGQSIVLPPTKSLIIGRTGADFCPDVDLTPFGADEKGVSRQHVRLTRDIFIYVADIGSTNGTYINGQRLFINSDCLLNDGDDLRIGHLKVHVKFQWNRGE